MPAKLTKESIIEKIAKKGDKGATKSEIYKGKNKEEFEKLLSELLNEGKIIKKGSRFSLKDSSNTLPIEAKKEEYVKLEVLLKLQDDYLKFKKEAENEIKELRGLIYQLKESLDRAYDYINDVFLYMKEELGVKRDTPNVEDLRIIYDNLNAIHNFGDSVPVPVFKDEVIKKFNISEDEINKILLELDEKEIIYLQTLDRPNEVKDSDRGIKFEGRVLYFITWMKK